MNIKRWFLRQIGTEIDKLVRPILSTLGTIERTLTEMILDIAKLKLDVQNLVANSNAALAAEQTTLAAMKTAFADLTAKLASGEDITQADIDGLDTMVSGTSKNIDTIVGDLAAGAAAINAADPQPIVEPPAPPTPPASPNPPAI